MKRHRPSLRTLLCVLAVLSWASMRGFGADPAPDPKLGDGAAIGAPATGPLPAEVFARLPFVHAVQISPDGQHWARLMAVGGRQMMDIAGISHGSQDILTVGLRTRRTCGGCAGSMMTT